MMIVQGSGWVYVAQNGNIKTTPNQSYKTDILMSVDMWEHSFLIMFRQGCPRKNT